MKIKTLKIAEAIETLEYDLPSGKFVAELHRIPVDAIDACKVNTRFAPDTPLSDDEQYELIVEEDADRTQNLIESIKTMPSTEPLIAYVRPGMDRPEVIHGNRRLLAARKAGVKDFLVYVLPDLPDEDLQYLRDFPETNPTKVEHSPFSRAKIIYRTLSKAESEIERHKLLQGLKKRYKVSAKAVDKADRTYGHMVDFCDEFGLKPEDRKRQYKAFESYDQLHQKEFSRLLTNGELERRDLVDDVAKAYLKQGFAHDDMKKVASVLACSAGADGLLNDIAEGNIDINAPQDLRHLTDECRLLDREGSRPDQEIRNVINRVYHKCTDNPVGDDIRAVLQELNTATSKFQNLLSVLGGNDSPNVIN